MSASKLLYLVVHLVLFGISFHVKLSKFFNSTNQEKYVKERNFRYSWYTRGIWSSFLKINKNVRTVSVSRTTTTTAITTTYKLLGHDARGKSLILTTCMSQYVQLGWYYGRYDCIVMSSRER